MYTPGSIVSGILKFTLNETKHYKYIQATLYGQSHVSWTESGSRDNETPEESYTSNKTHVEDTVTLWKNSTHETLGPGFYKYHFQFTLPRKCPSSFEGKYGHIRYYVQGQIGTESSKFEQVVDALLQVNEVVDINRPSLLTPIHQFKRNRVGRWCFCLPINMEVTVEIPRTGYCINEDSIPLRVSAKNGSSSFSTVNAMIIQRVLYHAEDKQKRYSNVIASVSAESLMPYSTIANVEFPTLQVPKTEPTIADSANIELYYVLNVVVGVSWDDSMNSRVEIPIVLGNVPFKQGE